MHFWLRLGPLELALNEKQIPQVMKKKYKGGQEMEGLEGTIVLAEQVPSRSPNS